MIKNISKKNILYALIYAFLFMGLLMMSVKLLFAGYTIDDSYHIVMSYRRAFGDRLFMEMWEPHQTSAFLCAVLIKIFFSLTGSFEGLVVFLRITGLVLHAAVAFVLFMTLKNYIDKKNAGLVAMIFFATLPKLSAIPEFSNMQLWFVTLSVCAFYKACECNFERWKYTFLSATFLAFGIITYPTDICLFAIYIVFFVTFRDGRRFKAVGLFSCTLIAEGFAYIVAVFVGKSPMTVIGNVLNAIEGDESHAKGVNVLGENAFTYLLKELLYIALIILLFLLVSHIFSTVLLKNKDQRRKNAVLFCIISLASFGYAWYLATIGRQGYDCIRLFFVLIPTEAVFLIRTMHNDEDIRLRRFLLFSVAVGIGILFCVTVITNLTLFHNLPFLQVAYIFSLSAIVYMLGENNRNIVFKLLLAIAVLSLGLTGYSQKPSATGFNIFQYNAKIEAGPAKGVRCDWIVKEKFRVGNDMMERLVDKGDKVLIISNDMEASALELYLVKPVEISLYSTICTPSFGEKYVDYFEQFPEKIPDVLVIDNQTRKDTGTFLEKYLFDTLPYETVEENQVFSIYRR